MKLFAVGRGVDPHTFHRTTSFQDQLQGRLDSPTIRQSFYIDSHRNFTYHTLCLFPQPNLSLYLQFSVLNPQLFILLSQRRVRLYPYIRSLSSQSISFAQLLYCNSVIAWYCHKLLQSRLFLYHIRNVATQEPY